MLLYLLRHGDSQTDESIPDHERALTQEGIQSITRAANFVERMNLQIDLVYSSPLLRARRTAEIVHSRLHSILPIEFTEHLKVGGDYNKLFALLNSNAPDISILLVGHEPYFSQLVSTLLIGTLDAKVDIRKASLCCLDVAHPVAPRRGVLKWLLPPQIMEIFH